MCVFVLSVDVIGGGLLAGKRAGNILLYSTWIQVENSGRHGGYGWVVCILVASCTIWIPSKHRVEHDGGMVVSRN